VLLVSLRVLALNLCLYISSYRKGARKFEAASEKYQHRITTAHTLVVTAGHGVDAGIGGAGFLDGAGFVAGGFVAGDGFVAGVALVTGEVDVAGEAAGLAAAAPITGVGAEPTSCHWPLRLAKVSTDRYWPLMFWDLPSGVLNLPFVTAMRRLATAASLSITLTFKSDISQES
jgi:hypothetical protein